jgi:multidrug efflux pump
MTQITLDEAATAQQTLAVVEEVERYLREKEDAAVDSTFAALGFGFGGSGQNRAMMFVKLRDFDERQGADLSTEAVASRANAAFAANRQARVFVVQPPAIQGLGKTGGFSMYLVDQSGAGIDALYEAAEQLVTSADGNAFVQSVRTDSSDDEAALRIDIDSQKAESFGVSLGDINRMLSVIFSGSEVNDFILGSALRPVIVQGAAEHRMQPEDIESWYARNNLGEMVPLRRPSRFRVRRPMERAPDRR